MEDPTRREPSSPTDPTLRGRTVRRCKWCGGSLILEEDFIGGRWICQGQCLQCGRIARSHSSTTDQIEATVPRAPFGAKLPRDIRGWRELMERPSRGHREEN